MKLYFVNSYIMNWDNRKIEIEMKANKIKFDKDTNNIEINTMEELFMFQRIVKKPIVINEDKIAKTIFVKDYE